MLLLERLRWRRKGIEASDGGIGPSRKQEAMVRLVRTLSSETSLASTPPWRGTPERLMATTRLDASHVSPEKLQCCHGGDAVVDEDVMFQSASEALLAALWESRDDLSLESAYKSSISGEAPAVTAVAARSGRRRHMQR
jgi:hypothetical protein